MKRRLIAILGATALASGLAVTVQASPAFAASCSAWESFGTSNRIASATLYNGSSEGARCNRVQAHIRVWIYGNYYSDYYGPQSNASSYVTAPQSSSTITWYGAAQPSTTWSEQIWDYSGQVRFFKG